ncbi:MAG: glycosyltransferase family 2 protein [Bacteroidota bacterium]|jgi:glycosyltransferase involved in cell wall biosynthesis|nr:glycosyltransferase [Bacteroidota bacterium]MCA6443411.1 glycosyltransferase [Bacteroidota bacterium]
MSLKVSIITITYNAEGTLEDTIQSVLNQSYNNIEYIIIDGKSTDGTMDIISKYSEKISKIVSEKDNGLYDAINKGINLATGDVIALLHADDFYIHQDVIKEYVKTFNTDNADAVYANLYYVDSHSTDKIIRKWNSGKYKNGLFKWGWMPPHPTFIAKKSIYNRFGVYRLDYKTAADYECLLRLIHVNRIKLAYLDKYVIKMRVGGKSNESVKNRLNANIEDRKAWEDNYVKPYFFTLILKPLRKISQFF